MEFRSKVAFPEDGGCQYGRKSIMNDLTGAWQRAATKTMPRASSVEKFSKSLTHQATEEKLESRTDGTRTCLLNHQKIDSGVLSSILANGRLGVLISDRLVAHYGSLAMVIAAPVSDLCSFGGLTKTQVLTIKAVHTAALRLITSELNTNNILSNDKALKNYLIAHYSRDRVESFRVLFLNSCNRLIADELMSSGTVNYVLPYPREIIRRAIELNATALILVHNHPSGDPTPSFDDIDGTIRIRDIAAILQIKIYDHIIISCGKMISFSELGILHKNVK